MHFRSQTLNYILTLLNHISITMYPKYSLLVAKAMNKTKMINSYSIVYKGNRIATDKAKWY